MLLSLVSLFIVVVIIIGIVRLVGRFWSWLGRGKVVREVEERHLVSPEVEQAIATIERAEAEQALQVAEGKRKPRLEGEQLSEVRKARIVLREDFLDHLNIGWYQVVI